MSRTNSPWIHQLILNRKQESLNQDISTDIAVIGGGIAGVSTAYFILKYTKFNVTLLEGYKIAHGATGHNAGQVVSYFEQPFSQLAQQYGIKLATKAQDSINDAWDLLEEIYRDTNLDAPFWQFTGYAGCTNIDRLTLHLENKYIRSHLGFGQDRALIADDFKDLHKIPEKYTSVYSLVPRSYILSLLETKDENFIAALPAKKGCLNSALFCHKLVEWMLIKYKDRFSLYEHTPIVKVITRENDTLLQTVKYQVQAKKTILCTNGFEYFQIENVHGKDINIPFHGYVSGIVGYMAGYITPLTKPATAISYLKGSSPQDPYIYLTRRMYHDVNQKKSMLICIGGPEIPIEEGRKYDRLHEYSETALKEIDSFLHTSYVYPPNVSMEYSFLWHGLMGYTKTGVRMIGPEPKNPHLLYNLGCNGVGILPSLYGGRRISKYLLRGKLSPSIFDPPDL